MTASSANSLPTRERSWYPRRVIVATLTVLAVVGAFWLLYRFSNVLFLLFVSIVLATALRPAVRWFERFNIAPPLAVGVLYLVAAALAVAAFFATAPLLVEQGTSVALEAPKYYAQLREELINRDIPLVTTLAGQLPEQLSLGTAPSQPNDQIDFVSQAIEYIRAAGWFLFGALAVALITFFWIVDRERIVRAGLLVVNVDKREFARDLWDTLEDKVGAFIRGQLLLCLSIGVLSGVAFFAIGLPNALLLAVLAGVLEAVPYLGPIATAAVAVVLTLAQAPDKIVWVIAACLVIQQIENAVLVPRIMDRAVGVNAVVTLLAIAAFGTLLGIGGAIMAIPLAVILQVLIDRFVFSSEGELTQEIEGRDQVSLLRYQAQDLARDLRERIREHEGDSEGLIMEERIEALVGDLDEMLETMRTPSPPAGEGQPA